ncbi:hypothetical protein J2Q11_09875 [Tenacibaculum finnmarkense genomovar finnmarkense]|uniref:hypothetical protein n=1 Tax=Tenacibaculum finnmarkense TaxID=2781243 RepID=UPI001E53262F|nr:hypothetical protein [Tenacibaculum finnmarkense]MCD8417969.1 hypothetical protein [Tenacibaculum finnmarkense genomovar finnmarkense]MCG8186356.1 hypothetical protein [Tenacibaculum finnmarkense genomovar finnmarkense]MCG8202913.1 hypothetical protein [Tenacibaculum finnmarkense genomovar finnmarkense]MCG8210157.1 hypothetical protein [Tenacibaculum finnmarkense genomovar finnmarkense]MCG8213194.1 hypothetical protein [Tenacibaculum finnmarkense genomovar finnmarkense]
MEFSDTMLNILLKKVILIFQIIVVYFLLERNTKENYEDYLRMYENQFYEGVVEKKSRDKKNHNNAILIFKNKRKINMREEFYEKIKVNDSIVKKKGSLSVKVFSNKHIYEFNFVTPPKVDTYKAFNF